MATKTTNYGLTKPSGNDDADISVINANMDIIDTKMKEIESAGGSGSGNSVAWTQVVTSGIKIAEVTIDGSKTDVYAPNSSGGGSSLHNYSTEEQIVGTWINGKPIYEKTFVISDFSFSQSKDFTDDLFTEIEFILGAEMYDTTSTTVRFVHVDVRKMNSNTIRLYNKDNWDSIDAYTLRYTKK